MNQFKKYFKPKMRDKLTTCLYRIRGSKIANSAIIMNKAKLLRFFDNIVIQNNSVIKANAELCACNPEARINIGINTTIGNYTFIYASKNIEIGNDVMIAPFVYIVDSNHKTQLGLKMRLQENKTQDIYIGNDVWIGSHCIITSGSYICDGAVIAANSVVNGKVEKNQIWAGSPAKKIGERS